MLCPVHNLPHHLQEDGTLGVNAIGSASVGVKRDGIAKWPLAAVSVAKGCCVRHRPPYTIPHCRGCLHARGLSSCFLRGSGRNQVAGLEPDSKISSGQVLHLNSLTRCNRAEIVLWSSGVRCNPSWRCDTMIHSWLKLGPRECDFDNSARSVVGSGSSPNMERSGSMRGCRSVDRSQAKRLVNSSMPQGEETLQCVMEHCLTCNSCTQAQE